MSSSVPRIEKISLDKSVRGLGFNIRGGTDNRHVGEDPGIFITTVKPNGAAAKDGRLCPGDKILEINGNDLRDVEHQTAVGHFHSSGDIVELLVERGAQQRIAEQVKVSHNDVNSTQQSRSEGPSSLCSWVLIPVTLIIIGGSAAALIWYLKTRR